MVVWLNPFPDSTRGVRLSPEEAILREKFTMLPVFMSTSKFEQQSKYIIKMPQDTTYHPQGDHHSPKVVKVANE